MKKFLNSFVFLALIALTFSACVKHEFDEPPSANEEIAAEVNYTLGELLTFHQLDKVVDAPAGKTMKVTVVSNDFSGNFYKALVVQDATGGITLRINKSNINTDYPIGSQLYIKTDGLVVGDYAGLAQLGGSKTVETNGDENTEYITDEQLDANVINSNVISPFAANAVSIGQVNTSMINTLLRFDDVQFVGADAGQTYADADNNFSLNRTLEDCDGNIVVVRSSGYADFAASATPNGKGSVTAILSVFGGTYQLLLNDDSADNVSMNDPRCGGGGGPVGTVDYTIGELLANYHEFDKVNELDIEKTIGGTVISSDETGNFYKTLVIQDGTGGISLRLNKFDMFATYPVGAELQIKTNGLVVGDYAGLPQLGGAKTVDTDGNENTEYFTDGQISSNILNTGVNNPITGNSISPNDVSQDLVNTLVTFNEVQFIDVDAGQSYADAVNQQSVNRKLEDCAGNLVTVRTSGFADFAGAVTPNGKGSITGVLGVFGGTYQLLINNNSASSVSMAGPRCGGTGGPTLLNENFSSQSSNDDINLTGWSNVTLEGTRVWIGKEFGGNVYAQASAYNSGEVSSETWLITPAIDVDVVSKKINFETAKAFYDHDGLSVWASTDFTGDASAATWVELNCTIAQESDIDHEFVPSGDVSLAGYIGSNVYIGFKYQGGDPGATGTFRIDNVIVSE